MELISRIKNILSLNNFNLIHLESVESTMISIKKLIGTENICMIADEQTSGMVPWQLLAFHIFLVIIQRKVF